MKTQITVNIVNAVNHFKNTNTNCVFVVGWFLLLFFLYLIHCENNTNCSYQLRFFIKSVEKYPVDWNPRFKLVVTAKDRLHFDLPSKITTFSVHVFVAEMTTGNKVVFDVGDKYKTVLNALIQQNYHVINDVYLDMFISHISGKSGEGTCRLAFFFFFWIFVFSFCSIGNFPISK